MLTFSIALVFILILVAYLKRPNPIFDRLGSFIKNLSDIKLTDSIKENIDKDTLIANELFEKEQYSKAEKIYLKTLELNHKNIFSLTRLGQCYIKLGRFQDAEHALIQAYILDKDNYTVLQNLSYTYIMLKKFDKAIVALRKIIKAKQQYSDWMSLARCYKATDNNEMLILTLSTVVKKFKDKKEVYDLLYQAYLNSGEQQKAERVLKLKSKIVKNLKKD